MSQDIFPDIDPASTSGTELAELLNDFKDAVISGMSGTSRPAELLAGGGWIDTTNEATPNFYWSYKVYTGTVDVEIFRVNVVTGVSSIAGADSTFEISRISADAVGPIARFVKQRVASNGQVLAGDIVGELRFIGRGSDSSNPVVAKMKVVAIDNETAIASGAYYVWETTPALATVAVEHMRLMNGFLGIGTDAPDSMVHARGATGIKSAYGADSANGAKITLEKERLAGTKATQNADIIGELDVNTTDSLSAKALSAQIKAVATEAHTDTARGTKLVLSTTNAGAAAVSSKMEIGDVVESVVRHKLNSIDIGGQDVATTATIAQLSATKALVEFTGSTITTVQGINSGATLTKHITLHNRSSAVVTLSHENASATAADRIKLTNASDLAIPSQSTVELFYCTTDSRWKLKAAAGVVSPTSVIVQTFTKDGTFTAPGGVTSVTLRARSPRPGLTLGPGFIDPMGNAWAWGLNSVLGYLGDGSVTPKSSPVAIVGGLAFQKLSLNAGDGYAFGLGKNGTLYSWGQNDYGNSGQGVATTVKTSSPVAVAAGLKFWDATAVGTSSGLGAVIGLGVNGHAYGWGDNTGGELGVNDTTPRSSPVAVAGGLKFQKVRSVFGNVLALTQAGAAYSWGANANGNLGLGNVTTKSSPEAVLGGLTFVDIYVNNNTSNLTAMFGLDTNGAAYGWGINNNGQLGVGNVVPRSSPVAVLGGIVFTKLFSGNPGSMYGITAAGALYAWGINTNGQLGVGDVTPRSSPVAVLGGLVFADLTVKTYFSGESAVYGLTTTGALYAWGKNTNGQLGVGDVTPRSSPVAVLGGLTFTQVGAGASIGAITPFVTAATADGTVYAWGANTHGNLGVGDVTPRSSPVAVLGSNVACTNDEIRTIRVTVVPTTGYPITLSKFNATFGLTTVGQNITSLDVEYT